MMLCIRKRDNKLAKFSRKKIIDAINKAMIEVDGLLYEEETSQEIADEIYELALENNKPFTVEEIQDMVVERLMESTRKDVATAYICYRYAHEKARQERQKYDEKLSCKDNKKQNANVDEESHGGKVGEASNELMKNIALEDGYISKKAKYNHLNNRIYIHDLSSYRVGMHNCLTLPIDDLAANGAIVRGSKILRTCKSFTSFAQVSAVWMQLQSLEQFGGVAYSHYDWSGVPYVRLSFRKHFKDGMYYLEFEMETNRETMEAVIDTWETAKEMSIDHAGYQMFPKAYKYAMEMTEKEVYSSIEALYHNLNTLQSRSGNQLPFSSINYGTCTLPEGRMVIKALLENSIAGIGEMHTTSIFPCGIFQLMKGVNREPGDPNYDLYKLALKSTATRLYPNYANVDWSGNAGYDRNDPRTYFATMGCRTANGWDINGFGQLKDGRGNICPITIILPTLAMEAEAANLELDLKGVPGGEVSESKTIELFFKILEEAIEDAKDSLIDRFNWICSQPASSAKFMFLNGTMAGYNPEEGIISAMRHGTLALGQLGLAETLQILIGEDHTTPRGMELAKEIEQLFKDKCAAYKEEYRLNFGVYYTPAENLCYTAMKKFQKKHGKIKNISDKDFFTNSMHVPVWKEMSPFDKIDIESQLTGYSSAGCITYVELDSGIKNNLDALEQIVNYAMDKDIPYFAVNVPNDTCLDCGYIDEFNDICPMCGSSHIQQLRRVTGYVTGNYTTAFNLGKQQEVRLRKKHGGQLE